jgi:hypothetical protein
MYLLHNSNVLKIKMLDVSLIFTAMVSTQYIHVSLLYIIKGMNTTFLWGQ